MTTIAIHAKESTTFTAEELTFPGKKGACFTLRDPADAKASGTWDENIKHVKTLEVYWNYSWGPSLVPVQPKTIEFVPMIWSGRNLDRVKGSMEGDVMSALRSRRAEKIFGFNEPDGSKQANMTPEQALAAWPLLESAGVPLCSPSCVHPDRDWMKTFMAGVQAKGYRVDFIGVHPYGGTNAKPFMKRMREVYELYEKRPLIITEFGCADWNAKDVKTNGHTPAQVLAFMKEVLPWMEEQDWILGYCWFPFGIDSKAGTTSALFDGDGNLTACGRYYKSVTRENPQGDQSITPDDAKAFQAKARAAESRKAKK